ncbi:hypothetical protein RSAG8_11996, partial [Rhizoctonia solani AG-8 WAC10335]
MCLKDFIPIWSRPCGTVVLLWSELSLLAWLFKGLTQALSSPT